MSKEQCVSEVYTFNAVKIIDIRYQFYEGFLTQEFV